jgi:hypothetical protein
MCALRCAAPRLVRCGAGHWGCPRAAACSARNLARHATRAPVAGALHAATRVGYLEQEPELSAGATVAENIVPAVQHVK